MTAPLSWRGRSRDALSTPERLAVETVLADPRMTVLLSRDGDEKARILDVIQRAHAVRDWAAPKGAKIEAPTFGQPRAARTRDAAPAEPQCEPLVLRAPDLDGTSQLAGALAADLSAAGPIERAAAQAIAALRGAAATLLDEAGGPIAQRSDRLRAIDAALGAAREDEAAERAQIEVLFAAAAPHDGLAHEHDRLTAEHSYWAALDQLWPDWQALQEARPAVEQLARFAKLPGELEARAAAVTAHGERAEAALRSARERVDELQRRLDGIRQPDAAFTAVAADVVRLTEELPSYRARLLALATLRARLSDLERALANGLQHGGGQRDVDSLAALVTPERRAELQAWEDRIHVARASRAAAAHALSTVSERVRDVSREVREQLAQDGARIVDGVDERWRLLWKLRRYLDEIWEVQSRAESQARTLRDREGALHALEAMKNWTAGIGLERTLKVMIAAAAAGAIWAVVNRSAYTIPFTGALAALGVLRLGLHFRARWVRRLVERRAVEHDRLAGEVRHLRHGCDSEWGRAAQLTEAIQQISTHLGLGNPASPEAVDAYEQALAAQTRAEGANTPLTEQVLELLDLQESEPECAAALASAEAEERELESRWEAWRITAELPEDVEVDRAGAWADEVVRLDAAGAERAAAAADLLALEPGISAWEEETRRVLRRVGIRVAPELCGSSLANELGALTARARAEQDRRERCAQLGSELHVAEQRVVEAEAELGRAGAAQRELMAAAGVGDAAALRAQVEGARRWREACEHRDRLQSSIDVTLSERPAGARTELATGAVERWSAALRECESALDQLAGQMTAVTEQHRAAEERLHAARAASRVTDLLLEREQVAAELSAGARAWKLRVLAAALLEGALAEHVRSDGRELLQRASATLATVTGGRFTAIVRADEPGGLVLERAGARHAADEQLGQALRAQVSVSLVLGRAAQLVRRGAAVAVVLDDALAALSPDEARVAAQEIADAARACPVVYITTAERREHILSAMPGDITVLDADAE